jgi:hypothetical protein
VHPGALRTGDALGFQLAGVDLPADRRRRQAENMHGLGDGDETVRGRRLLARGRCVLERHGACHHAPRGVAGASAGRGRSGRISALQIPDDP